jgi:UDP-2,3-diacylglucosamine pyrophosphatase LpxH
MKWIVVSDVHLGDHHLRENFHHLLDLLNKYSKKNYSLILNGDIFDFSRSFFEQEHVDFIKTIIKFKEIIYIEGNHDWFVSKFDGFLPKIKIVKELDILHNGKILKIIHGHQADFFIKTFPKFIRFLLKINKLLCDFFLIDVEHWFRHISFSTHKKMIKMYEFADVIISGHTHSPCVIYNKNKTYINVGDWVNRNNMCYALIDENGVNFYRYEV